MEISSAWQMELMMEYTGAGDKSTLHQGRQDVEDHSQ